MTSPRSRRTKLGTNTMAMAMAASLMSAPRSAATVRARISGGKEKSASIVRMITRVGRASEEPGDQPEGDGDDGGEDDDFEGRPQGDACPPDQPAEDVAAEVVGPEPVRSGRSRVHRIDVLGVGSMRGNQRSENGSDDHDE